MPAPRSIIEAAVASPAPKPRGPWDRWDGLAAALSLFVGVWIFVFKMKCFYGLGTTSDMYHIVQQARSWLEGRPFADNEFGDILNTHAYFFALPLGLLAKPFGCPGVIFATAAGAALGVWAASRTLRTLEVPGLAAALGAAALVMSPMSALFFYHPTWAFHCELLVPTMTLGLLHALLSRRLAPALGFTVAILSVKEEMPVLVGVVALAVIVEELMAGRALGPGVGWRRLHVPALLCGALSVVALPLLLWVVKHHPGGIHSVGSFSRLPVASHAGVDGTGSLAGFIVTHLGEWLGSPQVHAFPRSVIYVTLGLAFLRPHFLPFAVLLTLTTWLMQDEPLWPPRFATTMAFSWCVYVLAFASLWRVVSRLSLGGRVGAGVAALVVAVWAIAGGAALLPQSLEVYRMAPWSHYQPQEVADADVLFERYRREGTSDEPVTTSHFLFRYAHDRPLYWLWCLEGNPRPVWILYDDREGSFARYKGLSVDDYVCLERRGRFSLWKRAPGR